MSCTKYRSIKIAFKSLLSLQWLLLIATRPVSKHDEYSAWWRLSQLQLQSRFSVESRMCAAMICECFLTYWVVLDGHKSYFDAVWFNVKLFGGAELYVTECDSSVESPPTSSSHFTHHICCTLKYSCSLSWMTHTHTHTHERRGSKSNRCSLMSNVTFSLSGEIHSAVSHSQLLERRRKNNP